MARDVNRFIEIFRSTGVKQGWWNASKIVVAVSGGSDSMSLLFLLSKHWKGDLMVCHVEHGIRGDTSTRDASFVKSVCKKLNVKCEVCSFSVPEERLKGESIELAARRIRHRALIDVAHRFGANWIALGHNSDDVVETFMLNLSRGTGAYGLIGIPEIRPPFCRPVINLKRSDLRVILKEQSWSWVDDETNDEDLYLRNRMRNEIIPAIESRVNGAFRDHVLSLTEDMKIYRDREESEASSFLSLVSVRMPFCLYSMRRETISRMPREFIALVIRQMARDLDIRVLSRRRMDELLRLIKESPRWRFQWQDDLEFCANSSFLSLVKRSVFSGRENDFDVSLYITLPTKSGTLDWHGWTCEWSFRDYNGEASWLGDWRVSIPLSFEDRVVICPVAEGGKPVRGSFPWWLSSRIPLLKINDRPLWAPSVGIWSGKWKNFKNDSVKYDGVLDVTFTDPRRGQEGELS